MRLTGKNQQQEITRSRRREARRYDEKDQNSLAIGCFKCPDRTSCGGLHRRRDSYSCMDDCCGKPDSCDLVCLNRPPAFVEYMREINGFTLDNVPRAPVLPVPALPSYVPMIYHNSRREKPLEIEAAAVPLHELYNRRDGSLRYTTRAVMAAAFGVCEDAKIIAIGSDQDKPIETWWGLSSKRVELIARLKEIGIDAVTSPNYSVFTDVPRYNDLANIKRILIAWQQIVVGGLPGGLHINGRTENDYERLTAFVERRPEANSISFEFGTGAGRLSRQGFHSDQLVRLAQTVSRPLHLTTVGGLLALRRLAPAFPSLTYIDTSAFMKAVYRQRLREGNDLKIVKSTEITEAGAPIDELLASNIDVMRRFIERIINVSRLRSLAGGNVPTPGNLGTAASAQAVPPSTQVVGRRS